MDKVVIARIILAAISVFALYIIQCIIYRKFGLRNITYERWIGSPDAFEGDCVQMIERVSNKKLLPVPYLQVDSLIDPGLKFERKVKVDVKYDQYMNSMFNLFPYTRITRRHTIKCIKRGCYDFDNATLIAGDILGFEVNREDIKFNSRLLVFPRIIPVDRIPFPSHNYIGNVSVKRWIVEDPFMVSGVREYRYGDPLNRINWNATAKAGNLQVHKQDYSADPEFMIYLNYEISDDMWDVVTDMDAIETGISYAASIAQYAIENGIKTGFACNGANRDNPREWVKYPPEGGSAQLYRIMECLAGLTSKRSVSFSAVLKEDADAGMTGMDIIIIAAYISDKAYEQIDILKMLGNSVEIIWLESKRGDQ